MSRITRRRRQGREIVAIELADVDGAFEAAHEATVKAMRAGAEVIYQATFSRDGWRGRADVAVRVDEPSELGSWSYEPYDTKPRERRSPPPCCSSPGTRERSARSRDGSRNGCT